MVAFAVVLSAGGCGWRERHRKYPRATAVPAPRFIGTIVLVNADSRFVLIDGGSLPIPEPGAELSTIRSDRAPAVLTVSAVRRRPFVIADILRGEPEKGDRVFAGYVARPSVPLSPPPQ